MEVGHVEFLFHNGKRDVPLQVFKGVDDNYKTSKVLYVEEKLASFECESLKTVLIG